MGGICVHAGAHTIGQTDCLFFRYRLYNFTATGNSDPTINQAFLPQLKALCPKDGDGSKRVALDKDSQTKFDVSFFKNLRDGNAILESDQRLWGDTATSSVVQNYAGSVRGLLGIRFDIDFPKAMIKMSSIEVKTDTNGEIRKVCSKFN
jgi:peroxidase